MKDSRILGDAVSAAEVPFRPANPKHPLILLPTKINGQGPFRFVLDTGANRTLVSPELAQMLGLKQGETKTARGAQGDVQVIQSTVESIEVCEETIRDLLVAITDLRRVSEAIGEHVDGDLGFSFLQHFSLVIDYPAGTFRLLRGTNGITATDSSAAAGIPFRLAHPEKPLILVPVHVNGCGPYDFVLDTGAGVTVLSSEVARNLRLTTRGTVPLTGGGDGDREMGTVGTIPLLAIGSIRLENVSAVVANFLGPLSQVVGAKLDGIVGHNFLSHFRVTIDYPHRLLRLE